MQLNRLLTKKLTAYVASVACRSTDLLAAGAIGAVALAGQPAAADIILNNNPISIPIPTSGCTFVSSCNNRITVPWSFDNGRRFSFSDRFGVSPHGSGGSLRLRALSGNGFLAGPLAKGATIGPGDVFIESSLMARAACSSSGCNSGGLWYGESGYLGFEFTDDEGLHFGWAYLSMNGFAGEVTEFAYDTIPGESIEAGQTSPVPEPGTLGLLALGSLGLAFWRRKYLRTGCKAADAKTASALEL